MSSNTTGEYLESWRAHDAKVKPYVWSHRAVGYARSLVGLSFLLFLVFGGYASRLESGVAERAGSGYLGWLLFFAIVAVAWELLSFPFSVAGHEIERRFGLSKQSFGSWLGDKAKGMALGAVLGAIAMGILFLSMRIAGAWWWLVACTLLVGFSIVLAQLAPVLLIPLFFKLKPMEGSPLKDRLLALCTRYGIEVKDVYHLGLGEKTEKGNAAFTGLGRTKRIMIGDTLYEKFSADEVEAVFAHELGHQVNNDLWKGIFFSAFWMYAAFFLAQWLVARFWLAPAGTQIDLPYGLFLFFIMLSLVQMPIGVLQAVYSRTLEHAADRFAAETIGVGGWLASAMERLTLQNWSFFRPNPVLEFIGHSHPAPWRRIMYLRASRKS